mmetsp:Transcript_22858/g.40766  ORF Transcript_22858/g.40766 Transcript_22858/m.40766 type:complete len:106 (+) Transcript_22858:354-671(+)
MRSVDSSSWVSRSARQRSCPQSKMKVAQGKGCATQSPNPWLQVQLTADKALPPAALRPLTSVRAHEGAPSSTNASQTEDRHGSQAAKPEKGGTQRRCSEALLLRA